MAQTQLLPAYLVVGADEHKRETAVKRMKARLDASGMAVFNLDERDMSKDPPIDDIIASLNTLPMGADFRLVVLEHCDRLPKALSEPLVEYLADPSPGTVCLLVAESLAKNTRLYKAVAAVGPKAVVDCTPKKSWELPKHVQGLARAHGKAITLAAAEELVARAGENTRLLDNELKRLAAQVEGETIEREDVERLVMRTAEAKPWGFLDAVCERDMARALEQLALQPANSELRLWTLMVTRLRELIVAKALIARGQGRDIAAALGVADWQVKHHRAWAANYTMDEFVEALSKAVDVELALKGSRDGELAFRLWVCEMIG